MIYGKIFAIYQTFKL